MLPEHMLLLSSLHQNFIRYEMCFLLWVLLHQEYKGTKVYLVSICSILILFHLLHPHPFPFAPSSSFFCLSLSILFQCFPSFGKVFVQTLNTVVHSMVSLSLSFFLFRFSFLLLIFEKWEKKMSFISHLIPLNPSAHLKERKKKQFLSFCFQTMKREMKDERKIYRI